MENHAVKLISVLIAFLIVGIIGIYVGDQIVLASALQSNASPDQTTPEYTYWENMNATVDFDTYSPAVYNSISGIVLVGDTVKNSTDNGATWSILTESPGWLDNTGAPAVSLSDGTMVMFAATDNETWSSTDGGLNWALVNSSPQWIPRSGAIGLVDQSDNIYLIGGQDTTDGFYNNDSYISSDKGVTWDTLSLSGGYTGRAFAGGAVLTDGTLIIMAGQTDFGGVISDVWTSTDGISWTEQNANADFAPKQYPAALGLSGNRVVLLGGNTSSDIWISSDKGVSWSQIVMTSGWSNSFGSLAVLLPDDQIVMLGGGINQVWISTDNIIQTISKLYSAQLDVINTFILGIVLLKIIVLALFAGIIFTTLKSTGLIPKIGDDK
jgi:hypothetical protein